MIDILEYSQLSTKTWTTNFIVPMSVMSPRPVTSSCHTTVDEVVLFSSIWLPFHHVKSKELDVTQLVTGGQSRRWRETFYCTHIIISKGWHIPKDWTLALQSNIRLYFEILRCLPPFCRNNSLIYHGRTPQNHPHEIWDLPDTASSGSKVSCKWSACRQLWCTGMMESVLVRYCW